MKKYDIPDRENANRTTNSTNRAESVLPVPAARTAPTDTTNRANDSTRTG